MTPNPDVSVVVPVLNEERSMAPLVEGVRRALSGRFEWELVLVDDGSTDGSVDRAAEIARPDPRVRLLRLSRTYGQTTALQAGFDHSTGAVVVSMDGDLQNDPDDIPRLVEKLEEGYDLVTGYRHDRSDPWLSRRLPSRMANWIIRALTGVPVRDLGCPIRAYRRELVERLELYSDWHRYLPVLAISLPDTRLTEMPVRHQERRYGESKYGLGRTWRVLADLGTVTMIRWFRDHPLLLFTLAALIPLLAGTAFTVGTVVTAVWMGSYEAHAYVFPGASLLCFGLSAYLVMVGLLAEVALRGSGDPRSIRSRGAAVG